MPRHSKNNTASSVFTSYERSIFKSGTQKARLGHDSLKPFDACSISLEPVENPLADAQGNIYSKQAIYGYLLEQKKMYKQNLKDWKRQQEAFKNEETAKQNEEFQKKVTKFDKRENSITTEFNKAAPPPTNHSLTTATLNSYWVPSLAPEARIDVIKKPSKIMKSPFGHPIKLKDLVPLTLTPIPGFDEEDPGRAKTGRYMCPICQKTLNNASGVFCIKTTGHVYCSMCMDRVILPEMVCPQTTLKFEKEDLLELKNEGSGYAGSKGGEDLVAQVYTPVARIG